MLYLKRKYHLLIMKKLAWNEFTKCIHIHTTVKKLYWCWATKEGLTSWFLKDAEFSRQEKPLNKSEFIQPKEKAQS